MNPLASPTCPECGTQLTAEAPDGLCPACLMRQAMQPTGGGPAGTPEDMPTVEEVAAAFPQWEVMSLIGRGGMGAVYLVRQPRLNRLAALKLIPAARAERDPAFAGRFEREGELLARLHHPNIVTVHDSGRAGGFYYLLMEYVDGVNLRQAMRAGRFSPRQALKVVPEICGALQYAHDEGVLHRDIKPENILLDHKGRVKLADFGIAKLVCGGQEPATICLGGTAAPEALTQMGSALGTPRYMAPEQIAHPEEVDHRADIYSLGVVFYELLTGELPSASFAPPSQLAAVDQRVDAIVRQALEKERERRQHSAGEMKTQVETVTAAWGNGGTVSPAVPDGKTRLPWQRWLGIALMAGSLPFVIVSGLWLYLMSQERGQWNPAPAEAIVVSGSWLIALFLLVPGLILCWKTRHISGEGSRQAFLWLLVPLALVAAAAAHFAYHGGDLWDVHHPETAVPGAAGAAVIARARDVHELTRQRYQAGMANYLEVIDARYEMEAAEAGDDAEKRISARRQWAADRIKLLEERHKAGLESSMDLEKAKLERAKAEAEWRALQNGGR
jgi:predicted Ser/Thr protein kinase